MSGKINRYEKDLDKLEQARNRFISEIAKNVHLYDITPSAGRLYGTVFFAEAPMTLDDMSKALGMSKTSMSTGIRSLLDANMVERVWARGIRKDLYKTEDDWYKSFSNVFITRWKNATDLNMGAIRATKELLVRLIEETEHEDIREKARRDLEKLAHAEQYYDWLTEVISLFETGKIFEIVPKRTNERLEKHQ
ncbi:DNA-binding transcriptional regulator GbsR, MarR family [Evansella caseinilytica]|uniref:HTH-type transcriptional regulator n=1 Tax=Evansella caseinilytica TaxID=1503961 RepID=A0A1H3QHR0_9BACI|nr:GbsR/MarR family transcriptional regulator [Evansella caseinilytica]SDZ12671.1 DNA-binding transcriptional regulator GbsR, MarR family [Evansella caseinilytica]